MSWSHFLLVVSGSYGVYYFFLLLYDLWILNPKSPRKQGSSELVFSEKVDPQKVNPSEDGKSLTKKSLLPDSSRVLSSGPLKSFGGVSLADLVALAQKDSIEMTKAVPF